MTDPVISSTHRYYSEMKDYTEMCEGFEKDVSEMTLDDLATECEERGMEVGEYETMCREKLEHWLVQKLISELEMA